MCASPWAASRPSSPSTTWTARNGLPPRSVPPSAQFADTLIRRLRERFAPGGHAALRPGQMVSWRKPAALGLCALLARRWRAAVAKCRPHRARRRRSRARHRRRQRCLASGIARRLDLNPGYAIAAYEDPWHYLGKEQALPANVDPYRFETRRSGRTRASGRACSSEACASRLVSCCRCKAGTQRAGGFGARSAGPRAAAGLLLMPGDSPVGFRLPLGIAALARTGGAARRPAARSLCASAAASWRRCLSPAISFWRGTRSGLGGAPRTHRSGAADGRHQRTHRAVGRAA